MKTITTSQGATGMVLPNDVVVMRQIQNRNVVFNCPKCGVPMKDLAHEKAKREQWEIERQRSERQTQAILKWVCIICGGSLLFAICVKEWT